MAVNNNQNEAQLTLFPTAPPVKMDCVAGSPLPRPPDAVLPGNGCTADVGTVFADTAPDVEAETAERAADADTPACTKQTRSTSTVIKKPKFEPPLQFGPGITGYKGKLYLSPTQVFSVNARRQKAGYYAISGTLGMIDPSTGYLMQRGNDSRHAVDRERTEKGLPPVAHKHDYRTAVKAEINVKYQENPNYTQSLKAEIMKKAQMLANQSRDLINFSMLAGMPLEKLSLGLIFDGFGTAYLNSRTKSPNMRPEYERRIHKVSNIMGDLPLEEWTLHKLQRLQNDYPDINNENISEVLRCLDYISSQRNTDNPIASCLQSFIKKAPKKGRKRNASQQKNPANVTILPSRVENTLDKAALEHLGNPEYLAYILTKEGGLDIEDICALQIKHILVHSTDPLRVFIALRKNYAGSATHNYTFPLLPSGAAYLQQYISHLQEQYGDVRVQGDCFLLSGDPTGTTKYDEKKLKDFLTQLIQKEKMGYAALADLADLKKQCKSVVLLKQTYKERIKGIFSGVGNLTDDNGAIIFLGHDPLVVSVQSNHYRAFTDVTGQDYLYHSLSKDPRDPSRFQIGQEEHTNRRKSVKQLDSSEKLITYPGKASGHSSQTMEITLSGLKPGDVITLEALHGLYCIPIKAGA